MFPVLEGPLGSQVKQSRKHTLCTIRASWVCRGEPFSRSNLDPSKSETISNNSDHYTTASSLRISFEIRCVNEKENDNISIGID